MPLRRVAGRFERVRGDPKLIRDLLWGRWDAERFQIIGPKEELAHSADEHRAHRTGARSHRHPMSHALKILAVLDTGERREIFIRPGKRSLANALAEQGLPLNTRCGQRGLCRGCEVILREGKLKSDCGVIIASTTIQACRARLAGEATIQIPSRSRIEHKPQVGETFEIHVPYAHQPLFPSAADRDTGVAVDSTASPSENEIKIYYLLIVYSTH